MSEVYAVGTAVHSDDPDRAARLERAMIEAVEQALAEGVSIQDSAEILRRKQLALDEALHRG